MEITYQQHAKRKRKAVEFWLKIASDYNSGLSAQEIAEKYTNPKTGRHYTRQHIYLVLRKVSQGI